MQINEVSATPISPSSLNTKRTNANSVNIVVQFWILTVNIPTNGYGPGRALRFRTALRFNRGRGSTEYGPQCEGVATILSTRITPHTVGVVLRFVLNGMITPCSDNGCWSKATGQEYSLTGLITTMVTTLPTADYVPVQSRCRTGGSRVGTRLVSDTTIAI